jgi:hypothetical protein
MDDVIVSIVAVNYFIISPTDFIFASGPTIAFLIRLSFISSARAGGGGREGGGASGRGGDVIAPVFWETNFFTLRGNESARVCFTAGECGDYDFVPQS